MSEVTFQQPLVQFEELHITVTGVSMEPMLRQRRDVVTIRRTVQRLKKYDVALYKRANGTYVLHRVTQVQPDGYVIVGDNCAYKEFVAEDQIIGVMTGFQRKGKKVSPTDLGYRAYVHLWCDLLPIRCAVLRVRNHAKSHLYRLKSEK